MNGRLLMTTYLETVLSNRNISLTTFEPCNHPVADTRIILHLAHASEHGHTAAYIHTVDSDVVVLAVRYFSTFGLSELWVRFHWKRPIGISQSMNYVQALANSSHLLYPFSTVLTGCDTTSQFLGCGKKTAWTAWTSMLHLTGTLAAFTHLTLQNLKKCKYLDFLL